MALVNLFLIKYESKPSVQFSMAEVVEFWHGKCAVA